MRQNLTIPKTIIVMMGITFILSSCSTRHYKQYQKPVDKGNTTYGNPAAEPQMNLVTIPQKVILEDQNQENGTINDPNTDLNKSNNRYRGKINHNKSQLVKEPKYTKSKQPYHLLINHLKDRKNSTLKAKSVEKTALSGWVRIMIILLVIALILLIIGIFLTVFVSGLFWWLFYALAGLLFLAAIIVLILGLVGLI